MTLKNAAEHVKLFKNKRSQIFMDLMIFYFDSMFHFSLLYYLLLVLGVICNNNYDVARLIFQSGILDSLLDILADENEEAQSFVWILLDTFFL